MKNLILIIALFISYNVIGQNKQIIKVIVPNKTDEVYITGNQEALGNWNPAQVKMNKASDYEREISLELTYPAEFKFTKGGWDTEGIVKSLSHNPNLKMDTQDAKNIFVVKGWIGNIQGDQLTVDYNNQYIESKIMGDNRALKIYLPESYSPEKKYPVIYITDGGTPNFNTALSYISTLTTPVYNAIPECILVGIPHKNRNAELDVFWKEGGEKFKDFLFNEVVPFIDSNYSTSGFNTIVGHSDGAEYNHLLLLKEGNPFRGFISISTNLNTDVRQELSKFFNNYDGSPLYYFIANGTQDHYKRIEAGNTIESLFQKYSNTKIKFTKKTYSADHQSIVPKSLQEGLLFVFQDYRNMPKYTNIIEYGENYLIDVEKSYGLNSNYDFNDIDCFFYDIVSSKNLQEYNYMIELFKRGNLFEPSPIDRANHYFIMEMYPETIEYWNQAVAITDKLQHQVFYYNFSKAIEAYVFEENPEGAIAFLEKCKEALPKYELEFNYFIAKTALENKASSRKGKKTLEYCKVNYEENGLFSKEDLNKLKDRAQ